MFRLRIRDNLWMAVGAALFVVLILVILRFNQYGQSATQAALQSKRLDLVGQTRLALASASEAEKSSVMAVTDEDSKGYADQARAATSQAESVRHELQRALMQGGTAREVSIFAQFSQAFAEFQRVDTDLLDLAIKNTNIKAYNLAFGPAKQSMDEMSAALTTIVAKSVNWPDSRNIAVLTLGAEVASLRIQTLLAPHIAEENDKKMDELEAQMNEQGHEVQENLDLLAAHPKLSGDSDVGAASSAFRRYMSIKSQILVLSRENTNVRSLTISLTRKRSVMLLCQESLAALQQAIMDEPISARGKPTSPR
jgi:hypothetical protein